jgi:hypothetical protein
VSSSHEHEQTRADYVSYRISSGSPKGKLQLQPVQAIRNNRLLTLGDRQNVSSSDVYFGRQLKGWTVAKYRAALLEPDKKSAKGEGFDVLKSGG